jgi:hypothetical protein
MAGSTLVNYAFIERVFKTSFSMLTTIKTNRFEQLANPYTPVHRAPVAG